MTSLNIAVVGGGPAGLMAAEAASLKGASVTVYDQMPSLARKFLMAGKSGLNITHIEAPDRFLTRYPDARMASLVKDFGGAARVRYARRRAGGLTMLDCYSMTIHYRDGSEETDLVQPVVERSGGPGRS